jgi:hypothetical protein
MNKLLLLVIIGIVAAKNIILIGDSRFVGMAIYNMHFDYSTKTAYGGTGSNIRSTTPKNYNGDSIHVSAEVSASVFTFVKGKDVYNSMVNQLSKASQGTEVYLWLGVNNLAQEKTYNFYAGLAKTYTKCIFYVIPVTGVNENKVSYIKNSNIKAFNVYLRNKVSSAKISNLKFRNILKSDNPNILADGTNIIGYSSDGLHYNSAGYTKIYNLMHK